MTIRFYSGTNATVGPGVFLKSFLFSGLEGSPDEEAYWFEKEFVIPLHEQFYLPAGDFGYSYEFDNIHSGPILAYGGSGNDTYFWRYNDMFGWEKLLVSGLWDGFYMEVYTEPGNDPALSDINGYKFEDVNGDGFWDAGELGLGGWDIYLDMNENGQYESSEPNVVTDPNGYYEFLGLTPGAYTVAEVMQNGWSQTFPAGDGTYQLVTDPNGVYPDNNFGNKGSRSADIELPAGVDVEDLLLMASQWLESSGGSPADIAPATLDGRVDYLDFEVLSRQWLIN